MQVVDPHIHFWNLDENHYPWLENPGTTFMGDYRPIAKNHGIRELLNDAEEVEVLKVVHIEAAHDPTAPLKETQWLQSLADDPDSNGMPQGIVAFADLSQPDVERLLEAHASHTKVRGIRQILNVHPDPLYDYVGRHFMREPQWRKGFALLKKYDLSFDLQIYPSQMHEAVELAREHPETTIILNHTGMFVDRSTVAGWREWRDGTRTLANCPNVRAKISGLGMVDHDWTVESLRPYVLETIDAFGVDRSMFASNFPVDRLFSSYTALWSAYAEIVDGVSLDDREALFRRTAETTYRI